MFSLGWDCAHDRDEKRHHCGWSEPPPLQNTASHGEYNLHNSMWFCVPLFRDFLYQMDVQKNWLTSLKGVGVIRVNHGQVSVLSCNYLLNVKWWVVSILYIKGACSDPQPHPPNFFQTFRDIGTRSWVIFRK